MQQTSADRKLDMLISNVLRVGLLAASGLMIVGGVLDFTSGEDRVDLHHFSEGSDELRTVGGIIDSAASGDSQGLMQLAVLILLSTPIMRVVFACIGFAMQKDWKFVAISGIVLAVLIAGFILGRAG